MSTTTLPEGCYSTFDASPSEKETQPISMRQKWPELAYLSILKVAASGMTELSMLRLPDFCVGQYRPLFSHTDSSAFPTLPVRTRKLTNQASQAILSHHNRPEICTLDLAPMERVILGILKYANFGRLSILPIARKLSQTKPSPAYVRLHSISHFTFSETQKRLLGHRCRTQTIDWQMNAICESLL